MELGTSSVNVLCQVVNKILHRYGIYCEYQTFITFPDMIYELFYIRFDEKNSLLKRIQEFEI